MLAETRDRGLRDAIVVGELQRHLDATDAHLVDGQVPLVALRLHVGDRHQLARLFWTVHGGLESLVGFRGIRLQA